MRYPDPHDSATPQGAADPPSRDETRLIQGDAFPASTGGGANALNHGSDVDSASTRLPPC